MITLALFNNKGRVGKTTLAYHLAIMMSRLSRRVLVVDLDPQANLTSHFLDEPELEEVWAGPATTLTVADAVRPIIDGLGDIATVVPRPVAEDLWLLPGDLALSRFEEHLANAWPSSFTGTNPAAVRTTTAFHRIVEAGASQVRPDIVIVDVRPNLGAINRAALLTADSVLIPVGADLFGLQGLRNLGPTLREWRKTWQGMVLPRVPRHQRATGRDGTVGLCSHAAEHAPGPTRAGLRPLVGPAARHLRRVCARFAPRWGEPRGGHCPQLPQPHATRSRCSQADVRPAGSRRGGREHATLRRQLQNGIRDADPGRAPATR